MTAKPGHLKKVLWHLFFFAALTVPFYIFNIDLKIESWFFNANGMKWFTSENPFFAFLYKYGTIPGAVLAALSIAVFSASFIHKKAVKFRKPAALIILTFLLGPGLLINVVCKNYTGRPRPREVKEFGGRWDFRQPFVFGEPGRGFSFPCGHASMGFVFYAVYLAYRKKYPRTSLAFLAGAFVMGGALGLARMAQGAHFASDVLWSAGITVLAAESVHYFWVKTWDDKNELFGGGKNMNIVFAAVSAAMIFIAAAFFMFATPFNRFRHYPFGCRPVFLAETDDASFNISVAGPGEDGSLDFSAMGFGLPWSDLEDRLTALPGMDNYVLAKKGGFSELNSSVELKLPRCNYKKFSIKTKEGDINAHAPEINAEDIVISTKKGGITLLLSKGAAFGRAELTAERGDIVFGTEASFEFPAGCTVDITAKKGTVRLVSTNKYFADLNKSAKKVDGSTQLFFRSTMKGGPQINIQAKDIEIGGK
jgi:membrane-associated PAP2 superfamily phosphatase